MGQKFFFWGISFFQLLREKKSVLLQPTHEQTHVFFQDVFGASLQLKMISGSMTLETLQIHVQRVDGNCAVAVAKGWMNQENKQRSFDAFADNHTTPGPDDSRPSDWSPAD